MKKIFCLGLIIYAFSSCSNENDIDIYDNILGEYRLESLISDIEMDLNRDGIYSSDFKKELEFYFNETYSNENDLKISRVNYQNTLSTLNINLPRVSAAPQYGFNNATYLSLSFISPILRLDKNFRNILSFSYENINIEQELEEKFSILTEIQNEGNYIYVKIKQLYFDEDDLTFKLVNLDGIYKKI